MTTKFPKATHTGNLEIGELIIPSAVLEDGMRVLSHRGVAKALGPIRGGYAYKRAKTGGGADLPVFLNQANLKPFVNNELAVELQSPVIFRGEGGKTNGIDAKLLPKICDVWLAARQANALRPNQLHIAEKARILLGGFAVRLGSGCPRWWLTSQRSAPSGST